MKNYTMKRPYTDEQKEIILRALPTGITYQHYIYAATPEETEALRRKLTRFKRRNIFEFRPLGRQGIDGRSRREILTQEGIEEVFRRSIPDYLKKEKIEKISVRNGLNTDNFKNLIRLSDVQTFLYGAGVQTPYTLLTQYGVNPFILGIPSKSTRADADNIILYDAITDAMIDYITKQEAAGNPLPTPTVESEITLFLPNKENPAYKPYTPGKKGNNPSETSFYSKDAMARSFNNSTGLLIDFAHKTGFVIFKNLYTANKMYWGSRIYSAFKGTCTAILARKLNIPISPESEIVSTAIILCQTESELKARINDFEKMSIPFKRVLPIMMSQAGFNELTGILNEGIEQYENSICNEVIAKCECVTWRANKNSFFKIEKNGIPIYVGTLIDLVCINSIRELFDRDDMTKPIIACYDYQREYYEDIVGIPKAHLLIVPNDD